DALPQAQPAEHAAAMNASSRTKARHAEASRPSATPRDMLGARLDLEEGVFVECAGLVLLHPFLSQLFEALDIAVDGELVQPDRALSLLHFLATGEGSAPEHALVLPKLLCNLPLEEPAGAPIGLTPAEAAEAIALLTAVIGHWDALGSTS